MSAFLGVSHVQLKNRKVLVTGGEGFIGSHLVEALVELGADVTAMVQYNSFNSWGWIDSFDESVKRQIKIFAGDVREYDSVSKAVAGKEVVFHLAALISIPYSYQTPAAYVRTNVEGTLNLMEACRVYGVEKVVHTSTSEVYGTARYVPMDENHPLQGQSPYSASKIGADKIAESYYRSYGLPVATIRPFNTYGPRQSARAVIPTIISQLLAGRDRIKLGSLSPKRDLTFVKDTVRGFIKIAEADQAAGQVVNIGSGREISIGDLARKIMEIAGKSLPIECDERRLRPQKSEVDRLWCDNSKALSLIGWKPEYSLEEGLKETLKWFEKNMHRYKPDIYNV